MDAQITAPEINGEVYKIQRGPEDLADNKINPGIHVERGNVILDFRKPIQYLGLTSDEAKAYVMALVAAIHLADNEAEEKPQLDS